LSYYVDQDNLETIKAWLRESREWRSQEAERLEQELEEAEADLEQFRTELEKYRESKTKYVFDLWLNNTLSDTEVDIERYHNMLQSKKANTLRRIRDLIKQDREDLEWIWKLEQRDKREAFKEPRLTTKQQRAANWKSRKTTSSE